MRNKTIQPFLRWAGGKNWLIPVVDTLLEGLDFKNYYEPFLGGASVFFSVDIPKHAYLSDINEDLIETYIEVRDHPNEVIKELKRLKNTEEDYYRIRRMIPQKPIKRAARFIYLNQTSYNGIYRVNLKGEYNVPYGFRETMQYDYDRILNASRKLQKTKLRSEDFTARKYQIKEGDLVFLDPPYTVSHNKNGFIKYNQKLFSLDDQYRLSGFIKYITKKGAFYILTNAAHDTIREIFDNGNSTILTLNRSSLIGGKNAKREKVSEFIFTNVPNAKEIDTEE